MKSLTSFSAAALSCCCLFLSSCKEDEMHHDQNLNINYPAAFVVNGKSNNVQVIELSTNTVKETIDLMGATFPHHVYLNPAKNLMAVAITATDLTGGHGGHGGGSGNYMVHIINTVTGAHEHQLSCAKMPHNAVFSPDGAELWVSQSDAVQSQVLIYNTSDWSLKTTVNVGKGLSEVTFASDGSMAFATNTDDGTVSIIDPSSKIIHATVTVGADPVGAWPASNGKMYVDNEMDETVSEIDVATMAVSETFTLGFKPGYVAYSEHHDEVWVTDADNGKVVYYAKQAGTWMEMGSIPTGADAHAIAFSANGETAYVTNQGANTVSVIDVANHAVTATINVGEKPNGIALKE